MSSYTQPIRWLDSWAAEMRFGVTHAPSLHPPPRKLEAGKSQLHGKTQVFSAVSVGILDSDSLISHEWKRAICFRCTRWKQRKHLLGSATPKLDFFKVILNLQNSMGWLNATNDEHISVISASHGIISPLQISRRNTISWNHQVTTEIHSLKLPYPVFKGNFESMIFLLHRWDMLVPWRVHHS